MEYACLFLALPLLLGAPMSANSTQRSAAEASNTTPTAGTLPGRGLLVGALAGILGEGGMGRGFSHGSSLGLSLGYRFNPHFSLALGRSWQHGKRFPNVVESAFRTRIAIRSGGVQPYLEAGPAQYSYKEPASSDLQRATKSVNKYGFTVGAGADAPVASRISVGAGVSYHFGIEVLSFHPWSDNVDFDYFSVGIALTFTPGGTGWR